MSCVLVFPTEIQVHLQSKGLSFDEATIPWQGGLKYKTYNPGKITQYGLLVRMACEAVSGYICTLNTCAAERQNLETQFYQFVNHELTNVILKIC
jgi:hypothetical protein